LKNSEDEQRINDNEEPKQKRRFEHTTTEGRGVKGAMNKGEFCTIRFVRLALLQRSSVKQLSSMMTTLSIVIP
jgi:hypothetical protein